MGSIEEHLGNIVIERGRDLWKSPRGTVLRIEALALVAISLSFFLAFFGSSRRWSNRWILQKGILVAQVLSLSLGTYSIGLMQSSPVRSGMYPIWAVSLLALFGCVDPITTYIGLDYKGPLSKMIFQLCLYFGYVMLMTVSTISSVVAKVAIVFLSTITFMKGFHRALAFVHLGQKREDSAVFESGPEDALENNVKELRDRLTDELTMVGKQEPRLPEHTSDNGLVIEDVYLSYLLYRLLRRHFLGLYTVKQKEENLKVFERLVQKIDYKWALKLVDVELAFFFEALFTSNEFLHLYQAKASSFWALASFVGICFVMVVAATIPGAMDSHHSIINSAAAATGGGPCAGTSVCIVGTTTADLIVTLVILVSLALLQLVQLIWCLTSNWARVGISREYIFKQKLMEPLGRQYKENSCSRSDIRSSSNNQIIGGWVMRLRMFLVDRVNYFDKYLWQARLGQDSLPALLRRNFESRKHTVIFDCLTEPGVRYFIRVVGVLFLVDTTNQGGGAVVSLHEDVKASITEFLATIKSRRIGVDWSTLFIENGLHDWLEYLPYVNTSDESKAFAFTWRVMIWHIATWYCEEADKAAGVNKGGRGGGGNRIREKNRRVALDLSKYCTYLVVSASELLPGPTVETRDALHTVARAIRFANISSDASTLEMMQEVLTKRSNHLVFEFVAGVYLGKRLRNEAMKAPPTNRDGPELWDRGWEEGEESTGGPCSSDYWELLARVWVQTLLYAAPDGDMQAHIRRLAQGGEFITHIWALLYHLGIDKWEVAGFDELKGGAAAEPETTTEVHVQEDDVSGSEIEDS